MRRDELHAFQVSGWRAPGFDWPTFDQKNRFRVSVQTGEHLSKRLGLVRIELPRIHTVSFCSANFAESAERKRRGAFFFGKR